jgi:hypothetical protein
MFYWNSAAVLMTTCFYGMASPPDKYFRIFSPEHNSTQVIANNGLFTPLVNCTDISTMFYDKLYVADRFVFRRDEGNYKLTNISYFKPRLLVDDVNTMTHVDTLNSSLLNNNIEQYGNMSGFFENLSNLSGIVTGVLLNTLYLNYNSVLSGSNGVTLNIPSNATGLLSCFVSDYGTGEIQFKKYFNNPARITSVVSCFKVINHREDIEDAVVKLNDSFFEGFTNLKTYDYNRTGSYTYREEQYGYNLSGSGVVRYIDQATFPFNILSPCRTKIETCVGLFYDCHPDTSVYTAENLALPGNLFKGCTNLKNVEACFRKFNILYTLTQNSFEDCINLENVSRLFADDGNRVDTYLTRYIPSKLLYHGKTTVSTNVRYGVTANVQEVTTDSTSYLEITTSDYTFRQYSNDFMLVTNDVETPVNLSDYRDEIASVFNAFNYDRYRSTIKNARYLFTQQKNGGLEAYENANPEQEINPDYFPYDYEILNGHIVKAVRNDNRLTSIWEYDGSSGWTYDNNLGKWKYNDGTAETDYEISLYEAEDIDRNISAQIKFRTEFREAGTPFFCAPPDLFRYCTTNADIEGCFDSCGMLGHTNTQDMVPVLQAGVNPLTYGLPGRICPYLLKPLSSITSINGLFRGCKRLSYYTKTNTHQYIIPESFLTYIPNVTSMVNAFAHMVFPNKIDLNVFGRCTSLQNITGIFMIPYFDTDLNNRVEIGGIFQNMKRLTITKDAFAVTYSIIVNTSSTISNQYVTFRGVFTGSTLVTNVVSGNLVCQTFMGYHFEYVQFQNKSLQDNTTTNNYLCRTQ